MTETVTDGAQLAEPPDPAAQPATQPLDPAEARRIFGEALAGAPETKQEFIDYLGFTGLFNTIDNITYDNVTGTITVHGTTYMGDYYGR